MWSLGGPPQQTADIYDRQRAVVCVWNTANTDSANCTALCYNAGLSETPAPTQEPGSWQAREVYEEYCHKFHVQLNI